MNLTKEQLEKVNSVFEIAYEYRSMASENNSSATTATSDLLDELVPKLGKGSKSSFADRENNKEARKEAKQFIGDLYREFARNKDNKPDTTSEALVAYENMKSSK